LTFGIQSDSEYDRAVTGNLTGNPETVTYALNSFTTGGFFQIHLNGGISHRWLIVVAPYQYQQQITGNYLNFKYATGIGQITVATPKATGFNQRMRLRHEFGGGKWFDPDAGSYTEAGPEYSNQNNQLSGLLLPNGRLCPASDLRFHRHSSDLFNNCAAIDRNAPRWRRILGCPPPQSPRQAEALFGHPGYERR
jgi:hypothetical protein